MAIGNFLFKRYTPKLSAYEYSIQKIDDLEEYVKATNNIAFSKIVLVNTEISEEDMNCLRENGYISNQFRNGKYYVSVINDGQIIDEKQLIVCLKWRQHSMIRASK